MAPYPFRVTKYHTSNVFRLPPNQPFFKTDGMTQIKSLRTVTIPPTSGTEIAPLLAGSDYLFLPFTIHGWLYWCVW
jgi:hypothetical protein